MTSIFRNLWDRLHGPNRKQAHELDNLAEKVEESRQGAAEAVKTFRKSTARVIRMARRSAQTDANAERKVRAALDGIVAANEIMEIMKQAHERDRFYRGPRHAAPEG